MLTLAVPNVKYYFIGTEMEGARNVPLGQGLSDRLQHPLADTLRSTLMVSRHRSPVSTLLLPANLSHAAVPVGYTSLRQP